MSRPVVAAALGAALLAAAPAAQAGDRRMLRVSEGAPTVVAAARAAGAASPASVQRAYDLARNLQESVRAAGAVSAGCRPVLGWTSAVADAAVAVAEGYDRIDAARLARARRSLAFAAARLPAARAACRPSAAVVATDVPALVEPRPGAATFGTITARPPAGTERVELRVDGRLAGPLALRPDGTASARLRAAPGIHTLEARFLAGGRTVGAAVSRDVHLLPPTAGGAVRPAERDRELEAALRRAAAGFSGISGIWVHDLTSGRAASWNAGARFPAASTVKLGVMVEALRGAGASPDRATVARDVAAIGAWSSNLAVNRLLARIGGSVRVSDALRRMGARASTFPGGYLVATERPPATVVARPPVVSRRVTTAADLGAIMATLHRAARGDASALRATGLTLPQARLLLGTLLASEPTGDNRGLLRDAIGTGVPAAQKHGWISSARHTAAVVYTARGPVVIVVLTASPRLSRVRAAALGGAVVRAALTVAQR